MPLPLGQPQPTLQRNLRGAGFMSASMLGFACNDAMMKMFAPDLGLFPAIFLRSLFVSILVAVLVWRFRAWRRPPREDWLWIGLRSLGEVGAAVVYLLALMRMDLAAVASINQTLPLLITLAGAVFFAEPVGWRRWSAILAGFAGVLIIVRPGAEAFDPNALLAFSGTCLFALRDLSTKRISDASPPLLVTLITALAALAMGLVASLIAGDMPILAPGPMLGMVAAAGAVFLGYFAGILGLRIGELGFTAPFRYSILIWALLLGWLVFGEEPDAQTLAGAALIVSAGLYAFWREHGQARKDRARAASDA